MSIGAGNIFFVFCALVALVGALAVVTARSPIRSAVGLLATILGIAGLYLMLNAQLLAAIQLIVYAGAVVVLFVFVIMLIGPDPGDSEQGARSPVARGLAAVLLVAAAGGGMSAVAGTITPAVFGPAPVGHGAVETLGKTIYSSGLVPFELATALLLVAIVGAVAVARGQRQRRRGLPTQSDDASARMYGGPIREPDPGELPNEEAQP